MPQLTITIKKKSDGSSVLSCARSDGTVTWQRNHGPTAQFFPLHDLTHYAVETVMEYRQGFYGLLAEGWEFSDFGTPWPRGPISAEAGLAEVIVGFLDSGRASGKEWSSEYLGEMVGQGFPASRPATPLALPNEEQLSRIRRCMRELFAQWEGLGSGEEITVEFGVGQ